MGQEDVETSHWLPNQGLWVWGSRFSFLQRLFSPGGDIPSGRFRVQGLGLGFKVQGSGLRVQGSGFRVQGLAMRLLQ